MGQQTIKTTAKLSAAFLALFMWTAPASALSLEENGFEKGEVEIQYEALYTDDNGGKGTYKHEQELEAQFGVTDWLRLTVGIGFEEEEDESSFDFSEIEGSVQFKILDAEKAGFGFGLYAGISKEFAQDDDEKDEKEFALGFIAEKSIDKWFLAGNLFYISDIDAEEDEQFEGVDYRYQVKYQMNERIALGIEGYGTYKDFKDEDEGSSNEHIVGPVLYLNHEIGDNKGMNVAKLNDDEDDDEDGLELESQLGLLFGTNDESADITVKWGLEIEF